MIGILSSDFFLLTLGTEPGSFWSLRQFGSQAMHVVAIIALVTEQHFICLTLLPTDTALLLQQTHFPIGMILDNFMDQNPGTEGFGSFAKFEERKESVGISALFLPLTITFIVWRTPTSQGCSTTKGIAQDSVVEGEQELLDTLSDLGSRGGNLHPLDPGLVTQIIGR